MAMEEDLFQGFQGNMDPVDPVLPSWLEAAPGSTVESKARGIEGSPGLELKNRFGFRPFT